MSARWPTFAYGDRVAMARPFLQSIRAYTGPLAARRGTVKGVTPMSRGDVVYVHWDDGSAGGALACNLVAVDRMHLETY